MAQFQQMEENSSRIKRGILGWGKRTFNKFYRKAKNITEDIFDSIVEPTTYLDVVPKQYRHQENYEDYDVDLNENAITKNGKTTTTTTTEKVIFILPPTETKNLINDQGAKIIQPQVEPMTDSDVPNSTVVNDPIPNIEQGATTSTTTEPQMEEDKPVVTETDPVDKNFNSAVTLDKQTETLIIIDENETQAVESSEVQNVPENSNTFKTQTSVSPTIPPVSTLLPTPLPLFSAETETTDTSTTMSSISLTSQYTTELPYSSLQSNDHTSQDHSNNATGVRNKRQTVDEEYPEETTETETEEPMLLQQAPAGLAQCVSKTDLEAHKLIEQQHLQELKKELDQLQEIIQILREQQSALNSLNEIDLKYYQAYVNNSFARTEIQNEKRLMNLLEQVNAKLSNSSSVITAEDRHLPDKANENTVTPEVKKSNSTAENSVEINELKNEIRQIKAAIDKLSIISKQPMSQIEMQEELAKHKQDIENIKRFLLVLSNTTNLQQLHNVTFLRSNEYNQYSDPEFIQRQITNIQRQINQLMAKTRRADHRLRESDEPDEENDQTAVKIQQKLENEDVQLTMLRNEAERVKQSLEKFNFMLNQSNGNKPDKIIKELEQQQQQMIYIKGIIEDMIKVKQEQLLLNRLNQTISNNTDTKNPVLGLFNKSWSNIRSSEDLEHVRARSSDSDDLKKILKIIAKGGASEEDEILDDSSDEMEAKIKSLEKQLKSVTKKKKKIELENQIKALQRQIKHMQNAKDISEVESKTTDEDEPSKAIVKILQKMLKEFDKQEGKGIQDDRALELQKLQEAINKLKPKDEFNIIDNEPKAESTVQFESLLSKLIAEQSNLQPPLPNRPQTNQQQLDFLIKRLIAMQKQNTNNQTPYPGNTMYSIPTYSTFYPSTNYPFSVPTFTSPSQYANSQITNANDAATLEASKKQFFRGIETTLPENYNSAVGNYETNSRQLDSNSDTNYELIAQDKDRINGLMAEISELQNSIANLNNPSYVKKPEDQATIYKLDKQINDLKQVLDNINQHPELALNYATPDTNLPQITSDDNRKQSKAYSSQVKTRFSRSNDEETETNEAANELLNKFASLFEGSVTKSPEENEIAKTGQERSASSPEINNIRQRLSDIQKKLGTSLLLIILLIIR